nr:helix-turn-helix domain-containing protein [Streptomyces lydicamycinicus]
MGGAVQACRSSCPAVDSPGAHPPSPQGFLHACTSAVHPCRRRRTVYRFIAAGDLPVVDLRTGPGRSRVRVPAVSLDEFISRRAVVPPAVRR